MKSSLLLSAMTGGAAGLVAPPASRAAQGRGGAFGAPGGRFGYRASTMAMSTSSDVSAEVPSMKVKDHSSASQDPLFDLSDYADGEGDMIAPAVLFEDVESEYDATLSDAVDDDADAEMSEYESNALTDEEDRTLTDREDRLFQYVNNTQKVESCILVGVEDLSRARRARKLSRQSDNPDDDIDVSLTWTLEESMVEMRELIKTSGLLLKGEITQRLQEVNPRTKVAFLVRDPINARMVVLVLWDFVKMRDLTCQE